MVFYIYIFSCVFYLGIHLCVKLLRKKLRNGFNICYNYIGDMSMKKSKNKNKHKYTIKTKSRMFIIFLVFGVIIGTLGYSLLLNLWQIIDLEKEKESLDRQLVSLEEEKKILEADIKRLSDSDYIAKYIREKYLYSKEGELIIRIDE